MIPFTDLDTFIDSGPPLPPRSVIKGEIFFVTKFHTIQGLKLAVFRVGPSFFKSVRPRAE
jgi:hypothetical protein